jgi:hypothetical protein
LASSAWARWAGVAQSLLRAGFNVHAFDLRDEVLRLRGSR